jgi:hypothetical protein
MKKIVLACTFLGIFGALGILGVGCSGNACEAAADRSLAKLESCGVDIPDATGTGEAAACSEADGKLLGCQADCVEAADCNCVNPAKIMDCTMENAKTYADCISKCK